jgi:hypothetical protein
MLKKIRLPTIKQKIAIGVIVFLLLIFWFIYLQTEVMANLRAENQLHQKTKFKKKEEKTLETTPKSSKETSQSSTESKLEPAKTEAEQKRTTPEPQTQPPQEPSSTSQPAPEPNPQPAPVIIENVEVTGEQFKLLLERGGTLTFKACHITLNNTTIDILNDLTLDLTDSTLDIYGQVRFNAFAQNESFSGGKFDGKEGGALWFNVISENATFKEATYNNVHLTGHHIFDIGGSQLVKIQNNQFQGYTGVFNPNDPHSYYSEIIQVNRITAGAYGYDESHTNALIDQYKGGHNLQANGSVYVYGNHFNNTLTVFGAHTSSTSQFLAFNHNIIQNTAKTGYTGDFYQVVHFYDEVLDENNDNQYHNVWN